jgi:hypothetical protein
MRENRGCVIGCGGTEYRAEPALQPVDVESLPEAADQISLVAVVDRTVRAKGLAVLA